MNSEHADVLAWRVFSQLPFISLKSTTAFYCSMLANHIDTNSRAWRINKDRFCDVALLTVSVFPTCHSKFACQFRPILHNVCMSLHYFTLNKYVCFLLGIVPIHLNAKEGTCSCGLVMLSGICQQPFQCWKQCQWSSQSQ